MIKDIYCVLDRCCYKSNNLSGVYLYIPGCRRKTPGWSRDSYNTRRKTACRCRVRQDTCRGGSGLRSPGQGHHSSRSNTCGNDLMSKRLTFWSIMLNKENHSKPLAVVASGVVSAGHTLPGVRVTLLSVAITSARATVRETPVSRQTTVTLPPIRSGNTFTLTRGLMAERVDRPLRTAITC